MKSKAFTLIELLIVVAIIAILAAIAVPNFLEAQTRAKVSRCKNDMRTLATAIESYIVDNNMGPTHAGNGASGIYRPYAGGPVSAAPTANLTIGFELTTPIAYLSSVNSMIDPFKAAINQSGGGGSINLQTGRILYAYINYAMLEKKVGANALTNNCIPRWGNWVLYGAGPDSRVSNTATSILDYSSIAGIPGGGDDIPLRVTYDPSNGTVSHGDIFRSQKYVEGCEEYPI